MCFLFSSDCRSDSRSMVAAAWENVDKMVSNAGIIEIMKTMNNGYVK